MPTCFVVMGFGKKTDFETGRTLDLDKTYRNIIKPAAMAAGLDCKRADEIPHSGVIDVPMYKLLLTADVVVADLSTSNKNAFYELGVRHALRPHTTIVICEDGAQSFPFDVNHVLIRKYHHMGEGIDFDEVERFRGDLTTAITRIMNETPRASDSPVYTFLNGLTPPTLREAMEATAREVAREAPVVDASARAGDLIYSELMQQVDEAQQKGDFVIARALLSSLRTRMKEAEAKAAAEARAKGLADAEERSEDPYIIQRLALATYKSKMPSAKEALEQARALLAILKPGTSNDPETLGLWGAVHKRLWEITAEERRRQGDDQPDMTYLDEALRAYERGFYLRNDYYNGINFAFLLNVRASESLRRAAKVASVEDATQLRAEAVASFMRARAVRTEVLTICETTLQDERLSNADRFWVLATMAEASLGSGDEERAAQLMQEASVEAPTDGAVLVNRYLHDWKPAQWMIESTKEQMNKLASLLAESPLKYIQPARG
jgi:hypothetical protein